ncbi:methylated-DNA--protein-cysteine methyltransferase isoform X8 [Anas platyrhynchos]|uniref:methylated-DNA--protein-cysteine methyltransferase isoform X8 n=1 Tax=Anas platyrhynchos TaxID=8839 RepID=UPI003AF27CB7
MLIANLCRDRDLSSSMASRRVPKVTSKEGASQCKEKHAVLLSPVGKLEISGCETGLHEIKLPKMSVLPNGAEASAGCEVCEGAEGMTEPLKQCTAWLHAYFCEPARTEQLPVPPFHHPLLQQDPDYNTVPQGDSQQRADRQLRRREPHERVAFVAREAPEREVSILMRLSHSCSTAKAHSRGYLAYNKLSEHPAEFRKMQNDYSGPGLLCVYFVPIPSPVLFYF